MTRKMSKSTPPGLNVLIMDNPETERLAVEGFIYRLVTQKTFGIIVADSLEAEEFWTAALASSGGVIPLANGIKLPVRRFATVSGAFQFAFEFAMKPNAGALVILC